MREQRVIRRDRLMVQACTAIRVPRLRNQRPARRAVSSPRDRTRLAGSARAPACPPFRHGANRSSRLDSRVAGQAPTQPAPPARRRLLHPNYARHKEFDQSTGDTAATRRHRRTSQGSPGPASPPGRSWAALPGSTSGQHRATSRPRARCQAGCPARAHRGIAINRCRVASPAASDPVSLAPLPPHCPIDAAGDALQHRVTARSRWFARHSTPGGTPPRPDRSRKDH